MSPSSRESNLAQYREALLQLNTQLFMIVSERRFVSQKIQDLKTETGKYPHFDPTREKLLFEQFKEQISKLSIKELLSFSLIMEDQAMAMAPGSYPSWSSGIHLNGNSGELFGMINPILLKFARPEIFERLNLGPEFSFLKQL